MKNQITPNTCGLACLTGVLADLGINRTQEDLLLAYKHELMIGIANVGQFGALNLLSTAVIAEKLGIKFVRWKDFDKTNMTHRLSAIGKNRSVIIGMTIQTNHMVKVTSIKGDIVEVLEPDFGLTQPAPKKYSFDELIKYDFEDWHFTI